MYVRQPEEIWSAECERTFTAVPKATIQFDLPEEEREHRLCVNAGKLASACWDADQRCRSLIKWAETPSDDAVALAEDIRQILREVVDL